MKEDQFEDEEKPKEKLNIEESRLAYIIRKVDFTRPIIALVGILCIIGMLAVSPFFDIKEVTVTGNGEKFSSGQLQEMISAKVGKNILFFNSKKAKRTLEKEIYIESANINKLIPDTIEIELVERKVRGYVPYMGSYLYIDEEGRVLETQATYFEPLPEVIGLKFSQFQLGEVLNVDNKESLEVVLQMSQMMQKYELLDSAMTIDVSNVQSVIVRIHQIEVNMGTMIDIDQKVRIMAEVLKTIPEEDRGTLDLSDLSKPIVFGYLT